MRPYRTLGEIAAERQMLDVACRRCERRGRLSTARLLAEYGADFPMPELGERIAADCPRVVERPPWYDRCGVHFVGLRG